MTAKPDGEFHLAHKLALQALQTGDQEGIAEAAYCYAHGAAAPREVLPQLLRLFRAANQAIPGVPEAVQALQKQEEGWLDERLPAHGVVLRGLAHGAPLEARRMASFIGRGLYLPGVEEVLEVIEALEQAQEREPLEHQVLYEQPLQVANSQMLTHQWRAAERIRQRSAGRGQHR